MPKKAAKSTQIKEVKPTRRKCLNPHATHIAAVPAGVNEFQIHPGYFKAGSDFAFELQHQVGRSFSRALNAWGGGMSVAGHALQELAQRLEGKRIRVDCADNHMVIISTRDREALEILRSEVEDGAGYVSFVNFWPCEGGKGYECDQEILEEYEFPEVVQLNGKPRKEKEK